MAVPSLTGAAEIATARRSGVLPVRIAGLGSELPSRVVTNDELSETLETSDEWIRTRTGIRRRRVAADGDATSDLAVRAARRALADAGATPADVSAILVATTTPDHPMPATGPLVAAGLDTEVAAMDVNAACSGFVYGLQVGAAMATALGGPVLLIGAETMSRVVDWDDRSTAVLFGDGAAAAVLAGDDRGRLGPFDLGSDGRDPSLLWIESGGTRQPTTPEAVAEGRTRLSMQGSEIYRRAVQRMVASCRNVLQEAELTPADVDLLVGHQANARILGAVADRLGVDGHDSHVTVDRHGNTSAASVPLALEDARQAGRLHDGDRVLLTAFGAGLTWGSCLLTWVEGGTS